MDVTKALLSLQCAAAARVAGNTKGFVAKGPREHSEPEPDQPGLPGPRSKRRCLLPQLTGTHPACPARTLVSLQACLSSAEPRLSLRPGEHEIVEPGPFSRDLADHDSCFSWQNRPFPLSSCPLPLPPPKPVCLSFLPLSPQKKSLFLFDSEPLTGLMATGTPTAFVPT